MTARAQSRGWPVEYDGSCWRWSDTREPMAVNRACRACGLLPTPEGYDACLGKLPGVVAACCGHGVSEPVVVYAQHEAQRE